MILEVVVGIAVGAGVVVVGVLLRLNRRLRALRGTADGAARADEMLKQRETLFRQLTESIADVIWISSIDSGTLHYVSGGYESIWGRTVESLYANPGEWSDAIVPEDRARVRAAFAALSGAPHGMAVEYRIARPDGTIRHIRDRGFQVRDADGVLIRATGIATDVTERRQIEVALQERQAELQALFDLLPAMIWVKDTENRILRVNKRAAEAAGLPVEAIEGRASVEIYPQDAARFHADDLRVIRSGVPLSGFVETLRSPGRADRWVQTDKVPYRDAEGKVIGIVVLAQDITDRKEAERSLRLLGTAIEQAGESILITDSELDLPGPRIVFVNPAFTRMTGYSAQEVMGSTPRILQGPHTDRQVMQRLREELRGGGVFHGEAVNYRKDGTAFDLEWRIAPITDAAGAVTHFVAVQRDITARKAQELALRQAKDAAVAASASKSSFLATMSHEIRTPLNAVIGMTDLLAGSPLTPDQRSFVDTIRTGGTSLLGVINDILDYSRMESGTLEIEHLPFEVRECLDDAVELVAHRAQVKGLELGCLVAPHVPRVVSGDAARIRQVLVNLLTNALKFTDHGEVRLEVDASIAEASCELHFAVVDTGIGIAPEGLSRLFRSFSQVDASTTRRYGGSGLGLAICKTLCELMGGRVWVESVLGQGSTFHAAVRCATVLAGDDRSYRSLSTALFLKRVLIVDDNATNREILLRQTTSWGMVPTVCASGAEALALLNGAETFDVAILDMAMPGMDGEMLAREIHAIAAFAALPLILLTSLARLNAALVGPGAPFSAHLTKPARHVHLREVLVGVVTQAARSRTEPVGPAPAETRRTDAPTLKILLVEDTAVNRLVATKMLERLGYSCDVVGNGSEAVAASEAGAYDVILMDVHMPIMDGLEATRRIRRERAPGQGPWIVAMTASAMEEDRRACLDAGMNDYLAKPVRIAELEAGLRRAVAAAPVRKDPGTTSS